MDSEFIAVDMSIYFFVLHSYGMKYPRYKSWKCVGLVFLAYNTLQRRLRVDTLQALLLLHNFRKVLLAGTGLSLVLPLLHSFA